MGYLASSNIFALINYTGFATWVSTGEGFGLAGGKGAGEGCGGRGGGMWRGWW